MNAIWRRPALWGLWAGIFLSSVNLAEVVLLTLKNFGVVGLGGVTIAVFSHPTTFLAAWILGALWGFLLGSSAGGIWAARQDENFAIAKKSCFRRGVFLMFLSLGWSGLLFFFGCSSVLLFSLPPSIQIGIWSHIGLLLLLNFPLQCAVLLCLFSFFLPANKSQCVQVTDSLRL